MSVIECHGSRMGLMGEEAAARIRAHGRATSPRPPHSACVGVEGGDIPRGVRDVAHLPDAARIGQPPGLRSRQPRTAEDSYRLT
jgi:hypothetical protein